MEKMKLSDDYRELEVEHVEWLQRRYGYLANFLDRYENDCVWASLAPGADGGCIWIGFTEVGHDVKYIEDEMLIPLSADEFDSIVEVDREDEEDKSFAGWSTREIYGYFGVSPWDFI